MSRYCVQSIPRGWRIGQSLRYPLTPETLMELLEASGLNNIYCVNYSRGRPGAPVVRARYRGAKHRGWAMAGSVGITVYAISRDSCDAIQRDLALKALPNLLAWLDRLEHGDNDVRMDDHIWEAYYESEGLHIHHDAL